MVRFGEVVSVQDPGWLGLGMVWYGMVWLGLGARSHRHSDFTRRPHRAERDPDTGGITETTIRKNTNQDHKI